jgi:hypothetical protein
MFYYIFQEDGACWYRGAVYQILKTFELRQRQTGVTLPMGQRQNPVMGVQRSAARPRAATPRKSLARRIMHRPCLLQSQGAGVPRNSFYPRPVVEQETEIRLPPIELPDPEGFYASLVLRQIRSPLLPGWELSKDDCSSPQSSAAHRSVAAQTTREGACCGTGPEPLETLLVEMALRRVQTPDLGGRSS